MSDIITIKTTDIVIMSPSGDTSSDLLAAWGIHDKTGALVVIQEKGASLEVLPEDDARLLYSILKRRFDT